MKYPQNILTSLFIATIAALPTDSSASNANSPRAFFAKVNGNLVPLSGTFISFKGQPGHSLGYEDPPLSPILFSFSQKKTASFRENTIQGSTNRESQESGQKNKKMPKYDQKNSENTQKNRNKSNERISPETQGYLGLHRKYLMVASFIEATEWDLNRENRVLNADFYSCNYFNGDQWLIQYGDEFKDCKECFFVEIYLLPIDHKLSPPGIGL